MLWRGCWRREGRGRGFECGMRVGVSSRIRAMVIQAHVIGGCVFATLICEDKLLVSLYRYWTIGH